jgi:hypothetical protein
MTPHTINTMLNSLTRRVKLYRVSLTIDSRRIPIHESVDQLKVLFNIFHKSIQLLVKPISRLSPLSLVITMCW